MSVITRLADLGQIDKARHFAQGDSVIAAGLKGLGNSSLFAAAAMTTGWLSGKVGRFAGDKLRERTQSA